MTDRSLHFTIIRYLPAFIAGGLLCVALPVALLLGPVADPTLTVIKQTFAGRLVLAIVAGALIVVALLLFRSALRDRRATLDAVGASANFPTPQEDTP